jgi:hypothetical protein
MERHINLKEVIRSHIVKSEADAHVIGGGDVTLFRSCDEHAEVSGENIGDGLGCVRPNRLTA